LSSGDAQKFLGRDAFLERFSLFGASSNDYDGLFEEKLALFIKVQEEDVNWHREFRTR
jgi:hypothetical protein